MRRKLLCLSLISSWAVSASANVVGADTQNFNPITNGLDFVTVHSSETLEPGLINFGLFLNYAVNSLPNYENTSTASRTNFSDSLLSADLNFGLGLMPNWDMGLSLPYLLAQSVDSDVASFRGQFAKPGSTEIRGNTKYRITGDRDHGIAVVGSVNYNQIQDNPFVGINPGPTFNLELAADQTWGRYAVGGNIGYRFRNSGAPIAGIPVQPFSDQYIFSTAVSYLLANSDIKLIGELFGSYPAKKSDFASDRDLSSLEALIGMKMSVTHDIAWHFGGGTEVWHGTASPDWRVYTGLNWTVGPVFSKRREVIIRVSNKAINALEANETSDPFAGVPGKTESFVAREILFKFNSDEVDPAFAQSLRRFAEYLLRPPGIKTLVIEGHTDSVGPGDYNLALSLRRAIAVKKVLVEAGLPAGKVKAQGYGESRPIADNGNFQGRAINRRVEFKTTR